MVIMFAAVFANCLKHGSLPGPEHVATPPPARSNRFSRETTQRRKEPLRLLLQPVARPLELLARRLRTHDVTDGETNEQHARNEDDVLGGHLDPSRVADSARSSWSI